VTVADIALAVVCLLAALALGFWLGWDWRGEVDENRVEEARWKESDRG